MPERTDRTTITVPVDLRRQAKRKAVDLDVSLSAVIRELLEDWIAGKIKIRQEKESQGKKQAGNKLS